MKTVLLDLWEILKDVQENLEKAIAYIAMVRWLLSYRKKR